MKKKFDDAGVSIPTGLFPASGNPTCTLPVQQYSQFIWALVGTPGAYSAAISREVLIDLTAPPSPDSNGITVEAGNEALVVSFATQPMMGTVIAASPAFSATFERKTSCESILMFCHSAPADGFLLDQTMALASPPAAILWSPVAAASYQTNATHIFITVPIPSGSKFFRLRKP